MRVVLLVPRRRDGGRRDVLWSWARDRWERYFPELDIVEGHHDDGPFNRSLAVNRAAELAGDWDHAVIIDADIFVRVSQLREALARSRETGRVVWSHRRWRGFSEEATDRVVRKGTDFGPELDGFDMDLWVERTTPISWSCCLVMPRAVWDDMGGFDERFIGWGFEDMAARSVIVGLYGWDRVEADVYHLWHERSEERIVQGQSRVTATPEYITNARLGRRYMAAVIRDYGVGDQPGQESLSAVERSRHVQNLMRDDARFGSVQPYAERARWEGWWPTLEELRDGAKAYRAGKSIEPRPSTSVGRSRQVTLVVHSGGMPETWPERSEYLRRSLASLVEHVSGPVVQFVLYSDWGEELDEPLRRIVRDFGFYVAGEGHHGYSGSMRRLWMYLRKRAVGEYVFLAEDDFVYDHAVDLTSLAEVLDARPNVSQVALLRHPAYQSERDRGGVLGWPESSFTRASLNGHRWLEHRNFWTANPSLFRRALTSQDWPLHDPKGKGTERLFGDRLFRDRRTVSAFWGDGTASVTHIGDVRAGTGY